MKPFRTFIILAYTISWTIVGTLYFLYKKETITLSQLNILYALGAVGPFIAGVIATLKTKGNDGVSKLFLSLSLKNVDKTTVLLSISPMLFFVAGFALYPIVKGQSFSFALTKQQYQLTDTSSYIGWALPLLVYAVLEEFGWRGFALQYLQQRYTPFKSSVIIWIAWALWHTPFFLWRFEFSIPMVFGFLFGIFVGSLILTYLFNASRQSLLAVILFHFINNVASAFDKSFIVAVISTGLIIQALYLTRKHKAAYFTEVQP